MDRGNSSWLLPSSAMKPRRMLMCSRNSAVEVAPEPIHPSPDSTDRRRAGRARDPNQTGG